MCWGNGGLGQLGGGEFFTCEKNGPPVNVVGLDSGVIAVAAGEAHTCALTSGGGVKCWGDNSVGQWATDQVKKAASRSMCKDYPAA